MDNRMDGGGNEQLSSQPPTGMTGFTPVQADRSGTEALRNQNADAQATDANATPHSGGAEFHRGSGQESTGFQSGGSLGGAPGGEMRSSSAQSGWSSSNLQADDDSASMSDASKWTTMRDTIMETVRRNPVALALGLAGVAALLVALRTSRNRGQQSAEQLRRF